MVNKQKRDLAVLLCTVVMCTVLMLYLAGTAPTEAEMKVLLHAKEHGVTLQDYPPSLIALLGRNPETEEFVLNYPFREELETDLSSYDLALGVPLLMQWDQRWGYLDYGGEPVAVSGAAPVCLAMAGYYVTEDPRFYPGAVVEFALDNGLRTGNSVITQGARDLGLQVKELPREEKKVAAYLRAGAPIIAVMGPGDFTAGEHFIVLTAYEDGKLSLNDPNSYANSGKRWEFSAIRSQIRSLWVIQNGAEE